MSAGHFNLRRAGAGDAAAVRDLTRDVYAKWIAVIGREPLPMTADYEKAVREHWIDLLEEDAQPMALIEMIPHADFLLIENVAVAEAQQGRGHGKALLAHAAQTAKTHGLPELPLFTNAAFTENLAFYASQGFHETGRSPLADGGTMVHFAKPVS